MEILDHKKNHQDLMAYLPNIKSSLQEWLFIDIRLMETSDENFNITQAVELLHALFHDKEGKLYICNDREILILVHWGKNYAISDITRKVERQMPEGSCEVHVGEPTPEGIAKLEILVTYKKPAIAPVFSDIRGTRRENIILVADDDMYIRLLVTKAIAVNATIHEVDDGSVVMAAYKKYVPDILFLDLHMPNLEGAEIMKNILAIDPKAYIVVLSADSTQEFVQSTTHQGGAKGFLVKPFSKEKLQEYVRKCPTIS